MASEVTITKEDGKLVIVRKPIPPTWRGKFGCLFWMAMLIFLSFSVSWYIITFCDPTDEAAKFWLVVSGSFGLLVFVVSLLTIRDWCRKPSTDHPPDYDHDILTFDVDKFVVRHEGMVAAFAYRFDTRPVLCLRDKEVFPACTDLSIPCIPLDDYVPRMFGFGYCHMHGLDGADAESILAALKEHLAAIEPLQKK
jgi:hypothetical protein